MNIPLCRFSSFGIVTRLPTGQSSSRIPAGVIDIPFLRNVQAVSGPTQLPVQRIPDVIHDGKWMSVRPFHINFSICMKIDMRYLHIIQLMICAFCANFLYMRKRHYIYFTLHLECKERLRYDCVLCLGGRLHSFRCCSLGCMYRAFC